MKIGINLLPLRPGKNGGMEVYLRNLLAHLFDIDRKNHYYLITAPYNHNTLNFDNSNYTLIQFNNDKTGVCNFPFSFDSFLKISHRFYGNLEDLIDKFHLDLWFCPFLSLEPRPLKIPGIVTIPDIQHEYYEEFFTKEELLLRKNYIQPSCDMATKIITISEFSKSCLIEKLDVDPTKIKVIYLASGDIFKKNLQSEEFSRLKFNLPEKYFFYPANGWPHKNHFNLIKAFSLFLKSLDEKMHLVLSGSDIKDNSVIQNLISQCHITNYVHILDYVNVKDMPRLYRNALALVFPSLFEGFGIPLLEAMTIGCPIIASNNTSIPEIAGDAAYLFNPQDPQSIVHAMEKIVHDEGLRFSLVQKGKKRVLKFSYDTVAREHLEFFEAAKKNISN